MGTTQARKQPQPVHYDVEDDDEQLYVTRMPSSARRYKSAPPMHSDTLDGPMTQKGVLIQRRRSSLNTQSTHGIASNAVTTPTTETLPKQKRFPTVPVLVGMVIMVLLVMSLSALLSWWQVYQDDLHYGRPRTFQMDAVVGHGDSQSNPTHFIFLNLHRHVEIIEIPGGD
ncbi:MAG: hypothetical protein JOZ18_10975, partial [Chloroflexi bacterium]|nr:hypothetical protein [Chloroflexota bacterium]